MKNCWELMKCGRELNGAKVHELGVCPAALPSEFDGVNNGATGGRFCWAISGTLCEDKVDGNFAQKFESCFKCAFFKYVQDQEERSFCVTPEQARKKY